MRTIKTLLPKRARSYNAFISMINGACEFAKQMNKGLKVRQSYFWSRARPTP
jgi:hypothetical protein